MNGLLDLEKINSIENELKGNSERATAIVGAALIDEQLKEIIRTFFVETKSSENLLSDSLGAFSNRIKICECLGLLPPDLCKDIDLVREIRNRFAHDLHIEFTDEKIQGYISQIQCLKGIRHQAKQAREFAINEFGDNYKDHPEYKAHEDIGSFSKKRNYEVAISWLSVVIESYISSTDKLVAKENVMDAWEMI